MSRGDLVDAYQDGNPSRRAFVQGLAALGVSLAAANHLADQVHATPKPSEDVYGGVVDAEPDKETDVTARPSDVYSNVIDAEPEEGNQLTSLPSTGSGRAPDDEGQVPGTRFLGLAGASAAIAAAWLRRWRRNDLETR